MLQILNEVESKLFELLKTQEVKTLYIDYHPPIVHRIWFQYSEYRVYLHKIEPCNEDRDALYHPHPWESAMRIIQGSYKMGVGHSETNTIPVTDCTLILSAGTQYEMIDRDAWHYVNPVGGPAYSLMVTGRRNNRPMPVEPKKDFRALSDAEINDILSVFERYYQK